MMLLFALQLLPLLGMVRFGKRAREEVPSREAALVGLVNQTRLALEQQILNNCVLAKHTQRLIFNNYCLIKIKEDFKTLSILSFKRLIEKKFLKLTISLKPIYV